MTETNQQNWVKKINVLDINRPRFLYNVGVSSLVLPMSPVDILNPDQSLWRQLKAVSIYASHSKFSKQKGYREACDGGIGGVFYDKEGQQVDDITEMTEEFSEFLNRMHLAHEKGKHYDLVDRVWQKSERERDGDFWLRTRPTISDIEQICSVPYVVSLNLYISSNQPPEVDVWVE